MGYAGKDRRIHKMFITRNTEYHVRRNLCVGVRDRRSGRWLRGHLALKSRVSGGLRFNMEGGIVPNAGLPSIGDSLFFHAAGRDLVTSPIVSVERPPRDVVQTYPKG
ncbi:MAG: hypothetical protein ACOCUS_04085 [Polyangiales bacterium]